MTATTAPRSAAVAPAAATQRPLEVLGWAAYLACSWTWCIGMFLPVLLLRDHGTWAWVVFAIPNVVGAAAMGWVLQRPGSSERMVGRHTGAMAAFSAVTILFHVLFVGWVVRWLSESALGNWGMVAAAAGAAVVFLPVVMNRKAGLALAALVWAGSIVAFGFAVANGRLEGPRGNPSGELLYLAPVCLIGFALCPYLDLTFHRARQSVSTYGSVAAFTLGFGALFLAMIVFTLYYGPLVIPPDAARPWARSQPVGHVLALAVAAHMSGQSGFTVAAHALELGRRVRRVGEKARGGLLAGALLGVAILGGTYFVNTRGGYLWLGTQPLSGNEMGYRLFMSFYGLIAPGYVWLFVVPWRNGRATEKAKWWTLGATLAVAGAAYWIGFIETDEPGYGNHAAWLLAGVTVLLVSRPLVEEVARLRAGKTPRA
ncbi:MAG TPA: hypothetical protein VF796_02145 [Humisphaera sp.]